MTREIKVDLYAGGLVFWRASMTSAATLRAVCADLNLSVTWYEVIDRKALKLALMDVFARTNRLVRPSMPVILEDGRGCAAMVVVAEHEGQSQNHYDSEVKFFLHPDSYEVYVYSPDGQHVLAENVNAKSYRGMVTATNVGVGLESIVRECGGYKLRDNARIYYMPQARMSRWQQVTSALEQQSGISFFQANCPADAQTAAAVADNAVEELRERYRLAVAKITEVEAVAADTSSSEKAARKANNRRAELLAELDAIKAEAAAIDAGFRGYLNLAGQIANEIDAEIATAVLTTSI